MHACWRFLRDWWGGRHEFLGRAPHAQDADCLVAVPAVTYQRLADALTAAGFVLDHSPTPRPVTVEALLQQVRDDRYITLACRATSVELFIPIVPLQYSILDRAVERVFFGHAIRVTTAEDLILLTERAAFSRSIPPWPGNSRLCDAIAENRAGNPGIRGRREREFAESAREKSARRKTTPTQQTRGSRRA